MRYNFSKSSGEMVIIVDVGLRPRSSDSPLRASMSSSTTPAPEEARLGGEGSDMILYYRWKIYVGMDVKSSVDHRNCFKPRASQSDEVVCAIYLPAHARRPPQLCSKSSPTHPSAVASSLPSRAQVLSSMSSVSPRSRVLVLVRSLLAMLGMPRALDSPMKIPVIYSRSLRGLWYILRGKNWGRQLVWWSKPGEAS